MNLLTTEEVAEKLKVTKYTVYSLIKSGKLPALRIGRSFRIHEEELNDYLQKCIITHEDECDKCEYIAWCNSCGPDINCNDCIGDIHEYECNSCDIRNYCYEDCTNLDCKIVKKKYAESKKGEQNDRTGNQRKGA